MKRICCDCKKDLGDVPPFDNDMITHTYCPVCYKKAMEKLNEHIEREREYLAKGGCNETQSNGIDQRTDQPA